MDMILQGLIKLLSSFVGTLGFAIFMHAPRKAWLPASAIGGVAYRGTTLRTLLGLRSTAFSVSCTADTVTFHTRGYGHRVGMSQYGANAMALGGSDYRQILAHYYQGVEIVQYWEDFA